jgi:hypothetical protein
LGSGLLVSLNLVLMSKVLAPFWISSIGVSKMASRIINSGSCRCSKPVYRYYWFSWSLYFVGLCVIFRLFHFHISIKVPKQHSRQCKSQCCNGRTSKKRAIGLMYTIRARKVKLAIGNHHHVVFIFQRGENRIIKGTVYQWQNHIRKY